MAGTLDSYSTCPCRARFTASMVDDTYEKGSATSTSTSASSPDSPATALQGSNKNLNDENDAKHEHHCIHTDGAVQVASYILEEIKKNVRGDIAQNIRYFIDDETLKQRQKEDHPDLITTSFNDMITFMMSGRIYIMDMLG